MEIAAAVLLAIALLVGAPAAENPAEEPQEPEAVMQEIRDSADEILTTRSNVTTATQLLASLPDPESKVGIAVYEIADKTGQYVGHMGARSSVVSQGATEMVVTALKRSRQFAILDRIRFSDIMNEKDLKRYDRLAAGEGPQLGELTGADYVLSGAVTEYQVDRDTGGLGLTVAGRGGSVEFARATCAIDLRVTDTTTGEVVWTQSLKGEILGEKVGLQVFSFMGQNIVEFETGRGKQQVINLVARTLFEEAVFKLVQSGAL